MNKYPTIANIAAARGTSLTEMAGKMRPPISREHLSRLANGRSAMTLSQACQIARLLGVEVNLIAAALPRRKEARHKIRRPGQAIAGGQT